MTYGVRTGEVVLFTGLEGIGKTEIMRCLEHHFLKTTNDSIGIINLEEKKLRTIKGLVGLELHQPVHLPDSNITKEQIKSVYEALNGDTELVFLYSNTRS